MMISTMFEKEDCCLGSGEEEFVKGHGLGIRQIGISIRGVLHGFSSLRGRYFGLGIKPNIMCSFFMFLFLVVV